ncbi:hypothetical protein K7432_003934 [Basidiobolus ranarum]|uniref:RlpA-like protein double-psi beta-barrel domain-containing protein n=1 Tax=Basidiobolus ranarum TaxID=34480 RepID=A0ABR2W5G6_9FUNG
MTAFRYISALATLFALSQVSTAPVQNEGGSLFSKRGSFSGDGTYYNPGLGSCEVVSGPTQLIAALNAPQFGSYPRPRNSPACFSCAMVHGPKGSVKVQIVDTCPSCKEGDLDLSPSAFEHIADLAQGRVHITWNYVTCGDATTNTSNDNSSTISSATSNTIASTSVKSSPTTSYNTDSRKSKQNKPSIILTKDSSTSNKSDTSCSFERRCVNPGQSGEFETCVNGSIDLQMCAEGTVCKADSGDIVCTWA